MYYTETPLGSSSMILEALRASPIQIHYISAVLELANGPKSSLTFRGKTAEIEKHTRAHSQRVATKRDITRWDERQRGRRGGEREREEKGERGRDGGRNERIKSLILQRSLTLKGP